ncbi:Ig-like domain-containing protein [Comamonas sp.]|uniref:Ig-like domain-containing protein n=1 Tax=Comamonas sp. TaxID=34028 RepID=UPI0025C417F7|nr:Ig-like domain-containing protein [Comamonas sp.]
MTRKSRPFWNRLTQAMKAQAVKTDAPQRLQPASAVRPLALEQRFMFDGAAAVDVAHAATDAAAAEHAVDAAGALRHALTAEAQRSTEASPSSVQRQEVVFVDSQVSNIGELLAGLASNAEVVILDASKDGLQQMADYLQGRSGLDAIHLLSHGADGTVQMGNVWLSSGNLAEHSTALQSIGAALKADGDLLLYGCDVGQGDKGQYFLDQLAAITGADVAASADDTGAAALGGNWTLERSSGAIETSALSVGGYDSLMASIFTGGAVASAPVLGTTTNQMKYVVGDFNSDGRADILYQAAGAGGAWSFAQSNSDGTFTIFSQANSMFAGLTLTDAATGGANFHAGDFNGDGRIDLLAAPVSGPTMKLYLNTGSGFTSQDVSGPSFGVRTLVGDFNGDGALDVLYQTGGTGSSWALAVNSGSATPSFTTLTSASGAAWPFAGITLPDFNAYNYKAADVDGDGYTDLIHVASGMQMRYFRNNNGVFVDMTATAALPTVSVTRAIVADFDGDGDADILYQTGNNGTVFRYVRNDNGTFVDVDQASSPFANVTLPDMNAQQFRVGDFDGDGDLDLISTSSTAASTAIFYQSGSLPKLVSSSPADDSLTVTPNANITLTFDQSVAKGTGNIYIVRTSDNAIIQTIAVGSGAVTGSGTTWTIDPPADMVAGVAYAVRIDNKAFANANGQVYKGIQNNTALNFTVTAVAAPVIGNLNGDLVSYREDAAYVLLDQNGDATISDADSANFNGGKLTVQIASGGTSAEDVLFIRDQGAGANQIVLSGASILYNGLVIGTFTGGSNGNPLVITLTSNATATTVAALVQNLAYRNSNTIEPSAATRSVSISMDDGAGGSSTVSTVTLDVLSVNDAPVVNVSGTNPTYTENGSAVQLFSGATINTVETGQSVIQMSFTVTNVANGAAEKLVIDGSDVNLVNGTNVVTAINGTTVSVSVVSGTATITLTHSGLSSSAAQAILNAMAYRNDSESPNTANRVVSVDSVRDNGGTSNSGLNTAAVGILSTVTVVAVNDAPTLSGGPYTFPNTNEDTTTPGVLISTLLASTSYVDPDVSALRGIAVYVTTGRGTWQYSTDNSNWTDFGSVAPTSALLLSSTTYVRYIPDGANNETVAMGFRAWDQTSGSASANGSRGLADTSGNGGTSAFSTGTAQANLTVTAVNDAPLVNPVSPSLSPLTDTSTTNAGDLVSSLTGGITDVDTGAVKGIAITGLTATYGKWQFTTNGGTTWTDVGIVSNTAALILRPTDRVRFVPDGIHGETATITYKAWDQTNGTAGFQGAKINTSTSGGTSAYSTATDTASVTVTAVNDRPVLTPSGGSVVWTEGNNVASTPVVVDSNLTLSDPDGPNPGSATVRFSSYNSAQDVLALVTDPATMGNIQASWDSSTGILTLTSAGNQATLAQFQAALRAVTYNNGSESPTTSNRVVQFQVTDGDGLASVTVSRSVTITAVDDAPIISFPATIQVTEDVPTAITGISVSDVDSLNATVTLTVTSGTLSAVSAGGVLVSGTSTTLILDGSIANINTFIANNRLTFTTAANATAPVILAMRANTGSVSDYTNQLSLVVTEVNDAPVATVPPSITVTEDVASVISGISFTDVDAGTNTVTATFSVPTGTLTATSGLGVTVVGSGTGELTLSGSLADINFFLAANSLTFKTAQDATASVILTVKIDDNGNTGGPALSDTRAVTLNVAAVNDTPVNSVPGAQTAQQGVALAFNNANGNAISISDVDANGGLLTVTLTANNGLLTLGSLSGITLVTGTGVNNISMSFEGTLANINAALQSLSFRSASNFLGAASLTIETNDNGNSGSGGAKLDIDTVAIDVVPLNPKVTSVSAQGPDRAVKVGDEVLINVSWDQAVTVSGGTPSLLLETGLVDRNAVYVSGSGSNTLVFKYTVQAGDISADLDFQSTTALQLNGAFITNATSDLAVLTLPTVGGADSLGGRSAIVVDGVVPVVGSVQAPTDGTYIIGQNLDFTVNFSENVVVDTTGGVPRIVVTLDTGGTVYAEYVSGSGGSALVFRLTAASGQLDSNGVTLGSTLQLNGGSIRDTAGNDTVVTLNAVASTANVNVDGVVPTVTSVTTPLAGNYKAGDVLTFTVNASEALQTGVLPPRLVLDVGGVTRYATYVSGSGGSALMFQYIVQAGDNDANGIVVNSLDLRGEQLTDMAGNDLNLNLNGVGSTAGVAVDTQRPTATIVVSETALAVGEASTVTITFSEAVTDFNLADLSASNGTLSNLSTSDNITWTATLTPTNGVTHSGDVVTLNNSGVNDLAGNAGAGTTNSNTYSVDTQRPTATIVFANPNMGIGQTSQVTITFSEAVSDFTNDDLTVSNGTLSAVSSSDGGVTWTATFTPTAGISSAINHVILDNTGVLDGAGNAGSGTTTSSNYAIDGVRPTATVAIDKSSLIIGQTAQVTITFSEAVTGFSNSDLTVSGGTLSAVTSSDGGVTWTAIFTPDANTNSATNVVSLDNTGYTDTAGNAGTGTSVSNNYAIDTQRPTATIVMSDPTLRAGETSQVTITFSEAVTGFTLGDLNAGHGTLSNLSSSDGGITWTAIFTPDANTNSATNVVSLANTGVADIAGNSGAGTTSSANFTIDTVRPTAVIVMSNPALKIGDTSQVTITFSQAVSGFTNADLTVVGGTLSAVSSADGGITWTATFTPAGNISNAANHITLDNSGVNAASSGNAGTGLTTSNNYVIDTQRPTATIVVADNQLGIGRTSQVTITFSEAVTGFSLADLTASNGTLSNLTTSDNITWTATLTPVLGVNAGNNRISLANTGVTDIAGNAGSGTTDSNAYAVDSIRPTATIVISDPTLSAGESTTVTITFSEAVTGLDNTDLSVPNGTLGTLSSSDGGITWTATYTPNANVRDTSNVIALNNTGYTDLAGNAGVGVTNSANFTIDTVRPTATIVVRNPTLNVGATSQVTITFSEAVTGFTNADLTVENGTLSAVSSNDGGVTWSATFTPSVNITDTSNVITLSNSGVENAAGNAGAGTTTSNNYAIDTQRPTATITVANPNLSVGQTTTVTIAFNEVVTGFSLADLSVANGVLSNLASSDGGKTWTATLTPTVAITDPTNLIVLDTALVFDNAGNVGAGIAISNNYAIDTLRPTATIVVADTALAVGETSTVTITFSEAVNDFTNADLSVSGGTLSAVSSSDGGVTWTATFTPTANVESTVNRITLNNAGVTDKAGNAGAGTTDSNNYAIDTQRPAATIVVADTALTVGEGSTVTITFSEAVSGLTTADFTVANGTLSNLVSSDGGTTWTATLTPTVGITDTSNFITLDNSSYVDAAGNTGSGTTDSNNYAIDTQRPTATIVVADSALKVGETSLVTITFSEAVTGLELSDFIVEHGALSNLMSSDGGVTWTASLTPAAGITQASNMITLNNSAYVDAAGNSGTGNTASNGYAIDTQDPVALEIALDQATLVDGRQVSPTGLAIISGLEEGGSWQYSLDNGASWIEGRGNAVQLAALGAFNLWVQQKDAAGNASPVTSLNGIVEPLVPPAVQPPGLPAMNDLPAGPGLAPFQASEVSEPNADFLQSTSTALNMSSQRGGMHGSEHWSGYGVPQSIAGVNDWVWASLFAPAESNHSGFDPATEQFSVSTGASILDLKPVLLASDSPWDIESLRFSFADRQELPGWVRLDRQSGQLTIHAPKDLSTTLVLQIKVSDGKGHESVRTVKVVIGEARATSSAPAGRAGLSEKMANAANQQAGKRMSMYVHG